VKSLFNLLKKKLRRFSICFSRVDLDFGLGLGMASRPTFQCFGLDLAMRLTALALVLALSAEVLPGSCLLRSWPWS